MKFLLILCLVATDAPTAKEWAEGLASSNPTVRHATIDAIEDQDLKALPVLRELASAGSGEVRRSAAALIERIGTRRLLRPTFVKLNIQDQPLNEALQNLAESTGFSIDLESKFPKPDRKITVKTEGRVSLLEAIDRIGAAAECRLDTSSALGTDRKPGVRLRLVPSSVPIPPTTYVGPYKVVLRSLDRHRQVVQARPPQVSKVTEEFFAVMDVVAEPGILIERNGSARVQEAIDNQAHDLKAALSNDSSTPVTSGRAWGSEELGQFSYRLPLHLPESRGTKIAKLRGFIPVIAVTRTDELFAAPTADIEGKAVQQSGITLTVTRAATTGNSGYYEITVQGEPMLDPLSQLFAPGPRETTLATLPQAFGPDDHLRIEDAKGRPFGSHTNGIPAATADGSRKYRVNLFNSQTTGPPAKLRYFGVAGVATEVPFEFRDLEIP